MVSVVEFHLLGPVEAVANGRVLRLGGPKQRALLALLLRECGRPVSADRLADELWQGCPPQAAAATLYSYVSRLRSALWRDAVVAVGGGYALRVAPETLDACRFEQLLAQGRDALARGAAGLAAERLHAALALWRGEALAGVRDVGGSLADEASRLDELHLVCVEERIEAELALGRHEMLVPELRALVAAEPTRERRWRQLLIALYRCGRQAEALAAYREVHRLFDEELGLEPGEELRALERAILRQELDHVEPPEARHNLPMPTTSFVGRQSEIDSIEGLLRDHRLVTVTGLGGTGKTRLALEVGWRQLTTRSDGVWLIDLAAVADPHLVPATVAAALRLDERTSEGVLTYARTRELLFLLDNCEHLVAACAELVDALLGRCPGLTVLATSRIPLAITAECEFALDPLPTADDERGADSPALRLLLERAAAVRRGLPDDAGARAAGVRISRELEGLPLALELAAARAKTLSFDEIAERLGDRFRFLRTRSRGGDPRHRTLETAMNWSYDLLESRERELLRDLAVFAGGAELDAIAEVCGTGTDVLDLLECLVDASLVRVDMTGARTRYRLLETVRQYAAGKLDAKANAEAAAARRARHAGYYLRLAEAANLSIDAIGRGPQQPERVRREQHNLRAALDWAVGSDVDLGLRLMLALENFWVTDAIHEAVRRYNELLARAENLDVGLRARATRDHAACFDVLEDYESATRLYLRSGELAAQAGDPSGVATASFRLGVVAYAQGDVDGARQRWQQSLDTFRKIGDGIGELQAIGNLGLVELEHGDPARGVEMVEASIMAARDVGWDWWVAQYHGNLAEMDVARVPNRLAEQHARALLEISWRMGNRPQAAWALALLARAGARRGAAVRALTLWATVEAVERSPGRFGSFDRDAFAAEMPKGPMPAPLCLDDAVAMALDC
jgi:predicted ATPase/DNA-binding SARP family transcriptional activator